MAQVGQTFTIRNTDVPAPQNTASHPYATEAWQLHSAVTRDVRRRHPCDFTAMSLAGTDGYRWRTSPENSYETVLQGILRTSYSKAAITGALKYLQATANTTRVGKDWWIAAQFQTVSPADCYRADRLTEAAAELDCDREARRAAATDLEDPIDFDATRTACRWCVHTPAGSTAEAVTALRAHEREAHPGDYWADADLGCPVCQWPALDEEYMRAHLAVVHQRRSRADVALLLRQARRVAARGRAKRAMALPVHMAMEAATPAAASPGRPPAAAALLKDDQEMRAQLATLQAERDELAAKVTDLTARLKRVSDLTWETATVLEEGVPSLPVAAGQ